IRDRTVTGVQTCALPILTPQPTKQGYLAVLGRIAPEKGVDRAIKIAMRCGIPMKIAAKVDRADQDYYDQLIAPLITGNPLVEYKIGRASCRERVSMRRIS